MVRLVDVNNVGRDEMAPPGTDRLRSQGQDTEFPSRSESETVAGQVGHRDRARLERTRGTDPPDAPGRKPHCAVYVNLAQGT